MSKESYQCFICSSLITKTNNNINHDLINKSVKNITSSLSENLEVIYILRKLLQFPSIHLENQLKERGSDPGSWIKLCDECISLIKNAMELERKIRTIKKQLKSIQKMVVDEIKSSTGYHNGQSDLNYKNYPDENLQTFEQKIRSFVKTHDYVNSWDESKSVGFLEGDKLAKHLLSQQNSNTAQILMVEVESLLEICKEEIKLEVELPQSPESSPPMSPTEEDEEYIPKNIKTKEITEQKTKQFKAKCPICEKKFSNTRSKNLHMLVIHKDDPVTLKLQEENGLLLKKCRVAGCNITLLNETEENKHMEQVHDGTNDDKTTFKFKCQFCEKGFWLKRNLIRHEQIHKKKDKRLLWKCSQCEKPFTSKKSRDDHINYLHLKQFAIFCPICGKGFAYKRQKDRHMLSIHKDDPLTIKLKEEEGICLLRCSMVGCDNVFLTKDNLDKHVKNKHKRDNNWAPDGDRKSKVGENGQVLCGECGKWYFDWLKWTTHFWKSHQGLDFTCPGEDCEMIFKADKDNLETFKGHFEMSHETKKIICNICGQEMLNREILKTHKRIEHYSKQDGDKEKRKWICDICRMEKNSKESLRYHRKIEHKVSMKGEPLMEVDVPVVKKKKDEKVLCNLCGKEYSEQRSLDIHVRNVHDKQYKLSCHVCGMGKSVQRELNIHLLRCHKEDPVTRQLEVEKGLRLITCGVVGCFGVCLKQEEMDRHMEKVHKGGLEKEAKKFECTVCGKVFYVRAKLVYHEKVHEKDRNNGKVLKCESCGKGFDTKHYLRCHQRRVHKY